MIGNNFLDIMMHRGFTGHCYVLTETTLSKHPVILPKSRCDIHLFKRRRIIPQGLNYSAINVTVAASVRNCRISKTQNMPQKHLLFYSLATAL